MGINLLDLVKGQLGEAVMGQAAQFLGENPTAASKAMGALLPAVLGGVANQAATPSGAASLLSSLTSGGHDGSIFNSLGSMLGGGSATQGLVGAGSSIVKGLFGDRVGGIVDFVAQFAGIKSGSASSLMSMAAPLVMGAIGKQVGGGGLSSLTSLLGGQTEFIKKALPAGMGSLLGLSNLNLDAPKLTAPVIETPDAPKMNWMPWLLLGAAALAAFYFFRQCKTTTPEPPKVEAVTPPVKVETPVVDTVVKAIKLSNGTEINARPGSFLDMLYKELANPASSVGKVLTFDNVNFATASAVITEGSRSQLDDLAKVMKAFPKVEIKVDGHTDNVGNPAANKKLSLDRANAVQAFLVKAGIAAARVATAGEGQEKPTADNATAEGKAKNRRIEAIITKE